MVQSIWGPLGLMDLYVHFFPHFQPLLLYIHFLSLSLSPSGVPIMQILFLLMVSYKFHRLSSLFFILFFFCSSDWINSNTLSLILSSAWSILILKLSIELYSSVIVFFSSRTSVWFIFDGFYFFLFISFCSCIFSPEFC